MKKTLTIAMLVIFAGVCILFACKKAMNKPEQLSAEASNKNLRLNSMTCSYVDLSGALSTQTLVNTNIYRINGIVRIPSGVTVTVPAGTIFYGVKSSTATAWLVIEKGGKLIATGTSSSPIIFTSDQTSRAAGDWGGIAFAGSANNNTLSPANSLDIPISSAYTLNGGGTVNTDNSGNLQYVQILYAGKGFTNEPSKSSLILNSVGTGTSIDHVQVSNSQYDGIASYGGKVKESFMISYNAGRTDFPISFGYEGNMQFLAAMRLNSSAVPPSPYSAYGFDITNDLTGSTNTPLTQPIISNITVLGPNHCSAGTVNSAFKDAIRFALNGAGKIYNSVFSSWNSSVTPSGLLVDGSGSVGQTASNNLEFSYNSFDNSGTTPYSSPSWTGGCSATMAAWITGTGVVGCRETGNQFSVSTLGYDSSFCSDFCAAGFSQNFVLGTTTLSSPNFTWDTGSAFSHPTYRGAFGSTDFTQSWTNWCAQNTSYCQ